jgi:hypothetical protein
MFSESLAMHFSVFDSGFAELHAKLGADILPDSSIHHRQYETRS